MVINLLRSWKRIRAPQRLKKSTRYKERNELHYITVLDCTSGEKGYFQIPNRILLTSNMCPILCVIPEKTHRCNFAFIIRAETHFDWEVLQIFNIRIRASNSWKSSKREYVFQYNATSFEHFVKSGDIMILVENYASFQSLEAWNYLTPTGSIL